MTQLDWIVTKILADVVKDAGAEIKTMSRVEIAERVRRKLRTMDIDVDITPDGELINPRRLEY